jgi:hypothetical protein
MTKSLPMDTQNSLMIRLQKRTPCSEVINILPKVSKTIISRYNKRFFDGVNLTHVGKKNPITEETQLYNANSI